jgi:hypothetical protein
MPLLSGATLRVGSTAVNRVYLGSTLVWQAASPSTSTAPVGDLPGWTQVYAENFNTPATAAAVENTYSHIAVYPDGSGDGKYQAENVSVANGMLQIALHYVGGQGQGAALVIKPTSGDAWGQTYGRYSARVRADYLPGFGSAMQLWPSDDVWEHGETDYPEGDFSDQLNAYNHEVSSTPGVNSLVLNTGASWQDWHVVTTEWSPTAMKFYLDGTLIGQDTENVSSSERNWIIQAAEHGDGSATNVTGFLQIDWVAVWTYAGATGGGGTPTPATNAPVVVSSSVAEAATGTTVTVPVPAGTTAGHFMVAALGQKGTGTVPEVAGWTKQNFDSSTSVGVQVFTRWATANEPASYTFTSGTTDVVTVEIVTLSGVNTTTPLDVPTVKDHTASGTSFTFDTPLTTVTDHALVLYATVTQTTGNPLNIDPALSLIVNSSGVGRRMNIASREISPAGTVPTVTYTTSSSLSKAAVAIALRPA